MKTSAILRSCEPVHAPPGEGEASRQALFRAWESSVYPIGNGRLGGTVFGGPSRERVQFNVDSLWVGNEDCTGGYQPFGDLYVDLPHAAYREYVRELDIGRALQNVTYAADGIRYRREYFVSHPAQVLACRFTADRPAALTGTVTLGNEHDIPIAADGETLVMRGNTSGFWWWRKHLAEPQRLLAGREYASDRNIDLDFEARVRVLHEGGSIRTVGSSVAFDGCDTLTLLLAAGTNYLNRRDRGWRGEHPAAAVEAWLAGAARRPYDEMLAEHVADYQSMFSRMSITLGDAPAEAAAMPTPQRLTACAQAWQSGSGSADQGLEALLYQYGRYLMISSSRFGAGALPANLQGLWLINRHPAWRCDYHTDINVQMNYWFVDASNLGECFMPLAEWIHSIRDVRREETRRVLKAPRGWLMRSENGIFGGSTWHIQKGDSAWLCQNLWDHYAFTEDRAYLEQYAYPVMKEISEFWLDHLKELPDGTLVAPEGRSPEHGPVGVDGVTYDQVLCWDLFTNTLEASAILGTDASFRSELASKRERLLVPAIGRWGQLQEWMADLDDPADDHRHINHLICVYPGRQVHPHTTPRLAEAARVSLVARRDHGQGHPAWSRVWKACLFARLLDGESAYRELAETLATHIHGNLWAIHPPFQIDANFGYAAAVNEMLVQSRVVQADGRVPDGRVACIHLLPALPAAWPRGSVRGLRARGGYEVDMDWSNGQLVRAVIRRIAGAGARCTVRYGRRSLDLELAVGASRELDGPYLRDEGAP